MANVIVAEIRLDQLLGDNTRPFRRSFKLRNGGEGASIKVRLVPMSQPDERNNTHFMTVDTGQGGAKIYCGSAIEYMRRNPGTTINNVDRQIPPKEDEPF